MKVFVIAEHAAAASELCAGARTFSDSVILIPLVGMEVPEAVADTVAICSVPEGAAAENAATAIAGYIGAEGVVLVEPTRRCKIVAGKVAYEAGASAVTDVFEITDVGAKSLYFGGVAERVQKPRTALAVYIVSGGAFSGLQTSGANSIETIAYQAPVREVKVVSSRLVEKSGVDLTKADAVVAAGRGFQEEADLDLAHALCDKLGAGLACSRPLTEGVNWLPTELYVGVSGLMLSPKVYVAAGISGQMQHMVGCNRAATLFAINKDKNAPVFKQCDYGLVGDIKEVLPALTAAL